MKHLDDLLDGSKEPLPELEFGEESQQHRELCQAIWSSLGTWHRFLIGVDGVANAGKSTLARYLAWRLGASVVETDLFLEGGKGAQAFHLKALGQAIRSRLENDRPVIVEGILLLSTMKQLGLTVDYLVFVERGVDDSRPAVELGEEAYMAEFRPESEAGFVFRRSSEAGDG